MSYSRDFSGVVRAIAATLTLSLGSLVVAPSAFAQSDDDRAGARVAATEGVKAINEKRWADAADLFTRAESLVHSPVHLLYLARAQVQLGKLVNARENYNRIIREHFPADAPDAFRQAQSSAQQEVAPLEGRLAAITVKLGGEKGNVTVTDDGEKVPPALLGLPLPVDPGSHTFVAQGANLRSDPVTVTVAEGGKAAITLTVKAAPGALDPFAAAPANTPAAPATPTPAGPTAAAANRTRPPSSRPVPTGVYVGIAATGALAVAAGVTGVLTLSKKSDYDNKNDGSNPDQATSLKNSGQTLGLMSDLFTAGAVVAAGVTAYFFFSRPEAPASAQNNHLLLSPAVARDGAALNLSGRF